MNRVLAVLVLLAVPHSHAAAEPPEVLFHEVVSPYVLPTDLDVGPHLLRVGFGQRYRPPNEGPLELIVDGVTGAILARNRLPRLCSASHRDGEGRLVYALALWPQRALAGRWGDHELTLTPCDVAVVAMRSADDGGLVVLSMAENEELDVVARRWNRGMPAFRLRLARFEVDGRRAWSTPLPRMGLGNAELEVSSDGTIVVAMEAYPTGLEPTHDLTSGSQGDPYVPRTLAVVRVGRDGRSRSVTAVDGSGLGGASNALEDAGRTGNAVALGPDGAIHVVGETASSAFVATEGAFLESFDRDGPVSGFVTKLSPDGSRVEFSTLLGGAGGVFAGTTCTGVDVDGAGRVHVVGWTDATDFPTTADALRHEPPDHENLIDDGFLSVLDPTGSRLLFSTRIGDMNANDTIHRVHVDDDGVVTLLGSRRMSPYSDYDRATETGTWVMRLRLDLED